jgi:hypothetical protein
LLVPAALVAEHGPEAAAQALAEQRVGLRRIVVCGEELAELAFDGVEIVHDELFGDRVVGLKA